MAALLGLLVLTLGFAKPAAPTVTGPRDTDDPTPTYTFSAARSTGFRCSFDSPTLHRCASRVTQRLTVGTHVLRVRAVGRGGTLSKLVSVSVHIRQPVAPLTLGAPIAVPDGPGVPAVAGGVAWVPQTSTGLLARVDLASGVITSHVSVGAPGRSGDLDSAVVAGGDIWAASDAGARVTRVGADGTAAAAAVDPRPGGLAFGGGAVWAFHFLQGVVTRLDAASGAKTTLDAGPVSATGIAYGNGLVWVLTTAPSSIVAVDPATGATVRTIVLTPTIPQKRSFIQTWWLAFGDGALWATLPNYDAVVRVDAATGLAQYVAPNAGTPFGVALGGGYAWVATDRAVVALDAASGAVVGESTVPTSASGFVSAAYGDGAAWVTNFDRGTLTRVDPPG